MGEGHRGERVSSLIRRAAGAIRENLLVPTGRLVGAPKIHITSPLIRGGNYLYYWLWAFLVERRENYLARVEYQAHMKSWLDTFPLLASLTIEKSQVSWLSEWIGGHFHDFGTDFTAEELHTFCRVLVDSSPLFQEIMAKRRSFLGDDACVINVRRGDYYTVPGLAEIYGIDIRLFVQRALEIASGRGVSPRRFVLVSDDVPWCVTHVGPMLPGVVETLPDRVSFLDDLAALATAPTLLLANSTFSFWGAFLGDTERPDRLVIAPDHHLIDGDGRPYRGTYDPQWAVALSTTASDQGGRQ